MIRLAKPWIGEDEQRAVASVLETGQLVQGALVAQFEQAVAALVGRTHGVAVSSGTGALQLAATALGIQPGAEVLCPALSWPSPAHALKLAGAQVRFVDVDPEEWNSSAEALSAAVTPETKAAVVIDQFGNPAQNAEILEALGDLPLIEDAACGLGSRFINGPCGSLGAISCLSFHPRKIITTGEGGMCLTDDDAIARRLRILRDHGRHGTKFIEPAGNHRMTDLAAALGIAQIQRLDDIVTRRRALAKKYTEGLGDLVQLQSTREGASSNYQTLGVVLPTSYTRSTVLEGLTERDIEAGALSYAMHKVGSLADSTAILPETERIAGHGIALPLYPQMRDSEVDQVIRAMHEVLDG